MSKRVHPFRRDVGKQVIGTLSFALFLYVVVVDLRMTKRMNRLKPREETDEHA